ncbi:MAG: hypothetical protein N4A53_06555 [Pelagimonas sp.]|nr:hypothetical protein [Pelagimonas sp.]
MEEFFIASCRDFKDFRNEKVHNSFAISLDEHAQVLPMVFRILDVMSAIATSNVIYQPRRLGRSWIVDGTLLNDRFPSTQQIEVSEDEFGIVGGENFPTEGVLMSLPLVGFFKLNNHFCVTRDEATRTSKLEFKPWFRD